MQNALCRSLKGTSATEPDHVYLEPKWHPPGATKFVDIALGLGPSGAGDVTYPGAVAECRGQ
jgi:hypothetical protein